MRVFETSFSPSVEFCLDYKAFALRAVAVNSNQQSSLAPLPPTGRVAGVDYGTVRIGLATCDLEVGIATTYENYTRRSLKADAEYFRRMVREERIVRFVVGLPVHLSGEESQKSYEARQFGDWLVAETGIPVEYYDERFTSSEAEQYLAQAQLTKKQRKARLDMLAAQIMLAGWLESHTKGNEAPRSLDG